MKRVVGAVLAGLIVLFGMSPTTFASTSDFTFESFEADYYLGIDSDDRSTLKTVEKLVALFPEYDQNHGIERAIPSTYDGHSTSLRVVSVTDSDGRSLSYTTYASNDNEVLRIGDADRYVHGRQTYVITYTQRDVTQWFSDTSADEFYWDTNGTQWRQPFGAVSARVHIADELQNRMNGQNACYYGAEGAAVRCDITARAGTVAASTTALGAGENMTLAIGFLPGTFTPYEPSLWERLVVIWTVVVFFSSIIGIIAIFWLSYRYSGASNRSKELDPVAPEYIPPEGTSVLVSSQIAEGARAATTAALIDLAVRHHLKITQTKDKTLWRQAEYELEIIKSPDSLSNEEREFIGTLFGGDTIGTKLQTASLKNNYTLTSKLYKNTQALTKRIKGDNDLRAKDELASRPFRQSGLALLVFGVVTLSPLVLIAALVAYICALQLRPLTDKGLALRRYLAGLKLYIEAAEKERIKMLQSPEAVAKAGVSIKGEADKKLIHLYERVLPYAVLFGQEKEWNKQLAVHYEQAGSSPDWYAGHGVFHAAAFTGAMNDFSSTLNSYGTSTSSSSGGSSGGGSSGGGGGGGGGGGW